MGWQWHQLDHMQIICTWLQTHNHASTQFSQGGCPSCRRTSSVKALKANTVGRIYIVSHKKGANLVLPVTLSNVNRF